ncbi:SRC2 homolog [Olea europaea subsp. europaea]|uniref:SRC2 homolog n=1 Tax=Olea europaea subsp. europaea TaxID=158383 RepID=A0A8S0Q2D0_OLEEU|nr:SRC2 homolog [Olea europaea subsp. europaea]
MFDYFSREICEDGGKNPTFQEKFVFTLIEGLPELNVIVWNSNTLTYDDFIGGGKVQLHKVVSQGYDDSSWPLQDKKGRHAGEVRLIMHYSNANKPALSYAPSAPPFGASPALQAHPFSAPPSTISYNSSVNGYSAPSPYPTYPPTSAGYPSPYHSQLATYQPSYAPISGYPISPYPPPPQNLQYYPLASYPPPPYPPPPC